MWRTGSVPMSQWRRQQRTIGDVAYLRCAFSSDQLAASLTLEGLSGAAPPAADRVPPPSDPTTAACDAGVHGRLYRRNGSFAARVLYTDQLRPVRIQESSCSTHCELIKVKALKPSPMLAAVYNVLIFCLLVYCSLFVLMAPVYLRVRSRRVV